MDIFRWKDTYSVKVAELDQQHEDFLEAVGELHHAMSCGQGTAVAADVFQRLLRHSREHFASEEGLMQKHRFPGLAAHRAEHQAFTEKLLALKKEFDGGKQTIIPTLMAMLEDWLKNHVQRVD